MADTRTVAVRLKADVTSYTTSMKQASQSTATFDKQQARSQASAEKWRAVGLASKIGGAALAAGLLAMTKSASDQEQALGSLNAVFRENGALMTENAKNASNIGLNTTEYATAASKLGSQLGNLGVSQQDLAVTTDDLIKKASDLSAQFGGTAAEAVDALGAAMRGEADPAERYGLALNATAVNAEMAATGADKAHAMISLLNKQMTKSGAVGAWNREIDTAASQMQIAQKRFDDASASLGTALLPAMSTAAEAASSLLGAFNGLSDGTKQAITYILGFSAVALMVGPKVAAATVALGELTAATLAAGKAVPFLTGALTTLSTGGVVAGFGAAKLSTQAMAHQFSETTGISERLTTALVNIAGSGVDPMRLPVSLLQEAFRQLGISMDILPDNPFGDDANAELEDYVNRVNAGEGSTRAFQKALEDGKSPAEAFAIATSDVGSATEMGARVGRDLADAVKMGTVATTDATAAEIERKKALKDLYASLESIIQLNLAYQGDRRALLGQERRLTDAVKENGKSLDERTAKGRKNLDVLDQEYSAILALADSTYERIAATGDEEKADRARNRVLRNGFGDLQRNAEQVGFNADEVRKYANRLRDVPGHVPVRFTTDGIDDALAGVSKLERKFSRALSAAIDLSGLGGFGFGQNRAAGGYITGPGSGTSDDIPANLSNGEYVLRASAVKRIGVGELDRMNYANGGVVGYAKGGKAKKKPGKGKGKGQGNGGLGNVQKWTDAVKDARDNLRDIKEEAADYAKSIADNVLSGTGLFDMFSKSKAESATAGLASAQDRLAEASRKVAAAQIAVNTAAPADRATAIAALADAQRDLADAQTEQAKAQGEADAAAPTPANIMGRMKARADAIVAYASKVKTLMGKGLSMGLIKELAGADMTEAGPVLDALLSMSPEALKELSSVDKRAKDAAASIGDAVSTGTGVPGGGAFGGKLGDAKAELGVSTDGLDKAIKLADKKIDKEWRKKLAKMGLSAEERVQLMQSLRQNDGKLTREWRNKLAKAGLSAEERADLMVALGGADTTMGREWRDKTQKTKLGAEERADLIQDAIASGDLRLSNEWTTKLKKAGLGAEERSDLMAAVIANGGKLDTEWTNKLKRMGLGAEERAELVAGINAAAGKVDSEWTVKKKDIGLGASGKGMIEGDIGTDWDTNDSPHGKVNKNWTNKKRDIGLGASGKGMIEGDIGGDDDQSDSPHGKVNKQWRNKKKDIGLGAGARGITEDIGDENDQGETPMGKVNKQWQNKSKKIGLGARVDEADIKAGMYAAAMTVYRIAKKNWHPPLKVPTKPNKADYGLAMGGLVRGPGSATSDSISARLSNGEFVMRAAAVSKYGADMMSAINAGRYANGGPVGFRTTTSAPNGGAGGVTTTSVPIVVQLDGRTIAQSQLKLQRQSGGTFTVGG